MTEAIGTYTASDGTEIFTRSWMIDSPRYDMLIVHGLGEHSGRWTGPAEYFNAHGANVYSYDLRGHGRSGGDRIDVEVVCPAHPFRFHGVALLVKDRHPWGLLHHLGIDIRPHRKTLGIGGIGKAVGLGGLGGDLGGAEFRPVPAALARARTAQDRAIEVRGIGEGGNPRHAARPDHRCFARATRLDHIGLS